MWHFKPTDTATRVTIHKASSSLSASQPPHPHTHLLQDDSPGTATYQNPKTAWWRAGKAKTWSNTRFWGWRFSADTWRSSFWKKKRKRKEKKKKFNGDARVLNVRMGFNKNTSVSFPVMLTLATLTVLLSRRRPHFFQPAGLRWTRSELVNKCP